MKASDREERGRDENSRKESDNTNLSQVDEKMDEKLGQFAHDIQQANVVWVAFSGGLDSTVLLHTIFEYFHQHRKNTLPLSASLKAIHVHHGLSENADDWSGFCQQTCDRLGIELVIEKVQLNDCSDGVEQAAREARYTVFSNHLSQGDVLLQGHHQDDQIETFFMRLMRGAGAKGLTGIPMTRALRLNLSSKKSANISAKIIRPLLSFDKAELLAYAKSHSLAWVEDESNQSSLYERNRWRNDLLPKVWQHFGYSKKRSLIRTLENIDNESSLLSALVEEKLASEFDDHNQQWLSILDGSPKLSIKALHKYPSTQQAIFLRQWLSRYLTYLPNQAMINSILNDVCLADSDAMPEVPLGQFHLHRYKDHLFLNAILEEATDFLSNQGLVSEEVSWNGGRLIIKECELFYRQKLCVRTWQEGDIAKPMGRPTKKLKKLWQDYQVPPWLRKRWPIVINEQNEIIAVAGLFNCIEASSLIVDWVLPEGRRI